MCNIAQLAAWWAGILPSMDKEVEIEIEILKVEKDGKDGLIVTFSDGTIGGYVVEELLLLRPTRERVKEVVDSK